MKLTRRRHDNSANSMWWEWPIVRRNHLVDRWLSSHRFQVRIRCHADWMRVWHAIYDLPAFEGSNNRGNDYVDLRDLAGKFPRKTKAQHRMFLRWRRAEIEREKAWERERIEEERTRQWRELQEAKTLLRQTQSWLRDRERARSRNGASAQAASSPS
jgi:hypothetical protein